MVLPRLKLAGYIDATLLDPRATKDSVEKFCRLADRLACAGVCVLPDLVETAARALDKTRLGVVTVVGFPHGGELTEVKILAARRAIEQGATELDLVWNLGAFLSGEKEGVETEIKGVIAAANTTAQSLERPKPVVKVILECGALNEGQMLEGARLAAAAGAHYVKTGTGLGPASQPVTVEQVALLRKNLPHAVSIKAAGGISSSAQAAALVKAGASRLGVSRVEEVLGVAKQ